MDAPLDDVKDITDTSFREVFRMMVGSKIGSGSSRIVFDSPVLTDSVIKLEQVGCNFQNVVEWEIWKVVKDTEHSKWFAPCQWISPNGNVLIMKRTDPASPTQYLEKMPSFLADFKRSNYGLLNNQLVCHDYGVTNLMEKGLTKRMAIADWWDH